MKILQINNYGYVRGGSDKYFIEIGKLLSNHGNQISYFCKSDKKNVVDNRYAVSGFDIDSPSIKDFPKSLYSIDSRRSLEKLLRMEKPDIAHLHIYYGQISYSILSVLKKHQIPIVQTLHEYKTLCPIATMIKNGAPCNECADGKYWKSIVNRCNRNSFPRSMLSALDCYMSKILGAQDSVDHFISVSDYVRNLMIGYGMRSDKITTVHNFINVKQKPPGNGNGNYFLYFGRLEKIKGIMTLLKAMRYSPGLLKVVGEGTAKSEIKDYIEKNRMTNVELLGFKTGNDLTKVISESRCIIAPSEWDETFGLILIESFAYCKPVIASRIGGMTEIVEHGKNGFLFTPGKVNELANLMSYMWGHPEEAEKMGINGRVTAETRFSPEGHYKSIMNIYESLM